MLKPHSETQCIAYACSFSLAEHRVCQIVGESCHLHLVNAGASYGWWNSDCWESAADLFSIQGNLLGRLGRVGQTILIGYATAGAFASQAYLDEYWCMIFIFDAARRLVARKVAVQPAASTGAARMRLRSTQQPIGSTGSARPIDRLGHAKRPPW